MNSMNNVASGESIDQLSVEISTLDKVKQDIEIIGIQVRNGNIFGIKKYIEESNKGMQKIMESIMSDINSPESINGIIEVRSLRAKLEDILTGIRAIKSKNPSVISKTLDRVVGIFQSKKSSSENAKDRLKNILHEDPSPQLLQKDLSELFDKILAEVE